MASSSAADTASARSNYKGFVAGIFSGAAKLSVGHPFDTVKVRLQTTTTSRFSGPLQCLVETVRHEGVAGLYKGATPPLVGWMVMDSLMLGSLTVYRRLLAQRVFDCPDGWEAGSLAGGGGGAKTLSPFGHGVAGVLAGATVSFVAAPVEQIKARLQVQYAAEKGRRFYSGPLDCARRIYAHHGVRGLFHGLSATVIFRCFFFVWWSSYDVLIRSIRRLRPEMSTPAVQFCAGGLSAQLFWLTSYPADVVKQRIMTDPLGGRLGDGTPRFPHWRDAVVAVWREAGWRGYWRGFLPCFLRAFPANASALLVFEAVVRALP
ncbi:hypothetical protein CP532_5758 [Ophiocordyceps camponoti-leonardi (nom. inval.)]|nr:hypothetical protein CP532_5758 [Ophiocordyceps camponoti-leonardi (nom. inval.)]